MLLSILLGITFLIVIINYNNSKIRHIFVILILISIFGLVYKNNKKKENYYNTKLNPYKMKENYYNTKLNPYKKKEN